MTALIGRIVLDLHQFWIPASRLKYLAHCSSQGPSEQAVIPAQTGIQGYWKVLKRLDDVLLLLHALRAIRYANVRFGVPPPQSGCAGMTDKNLIRTSLVVVGDKV